MQNELIKKLLSCEVKWSELAHNAHKGTYLIDSDDNSTFLVDMRTINVAIENCLKGKYSFADLLDWANVVRFSDVFTVEESQKDDIIDVLDRIEESDEEGKSLSMSDLQKMLKKQRP